MLLTALAALCNLTWRWDRGEPTLANCIGMKELNKGADGGTMSQQLDPLEIRQMLCSWAVD